MQGRSTYAEAKSSNTPASPLPVVDNPSYLTPLMSEFVGGTGSDRNTVFREYMEQEEFCELRASDGVMSRDENGLFRKPVYHDKDGCEASR